MASARRPSANVFDERRVRRLRWPVRPAEGAVMGPRPGGGARLPRRGVSTPRQNRCVARKNAHGPKRTGATISEKHPHPARTSQPKGCWRA